MMNDKQLLALSIEIGALLKLEQATLTTAESCTGGWIAKVITDVAGSSAWFERGFVTYSNEAKQQMIGVESDTLDKYGAVSREVVEQMAQGARSAAKADYAISVSGIAGPAGGSDEKPVGTVWFGFASTTEIQSDCHIFSGDREQIRRQATVWALQSFQTRFLKK